MLLSLRSDILIDAASKYLDIPKGGGGSWLLKAIFFFLTIVSTSNAPADGPTAAVDAVYVPAATFPISLPCYGMSRMECRWHNLKIHTVFV